MVCCQSREKELDMEFESVNLKRVMGEMEYAGNNLNFIILDASRNNRIYSYMASYGNRGLVSVIPPSNTFIIFSTSPGYVTTDGNSEKGIFTTALLKYISLPNQSFFDLLKKVRATVINETNKEQIPWSNGAISFEFYFNKVD